MPYVWVLWTLREVSCRQRFNGRPQLLIGQGTNLEDARELGSFWSLLGVVTEEACSIKR